MDNMVKEKVVDWFCNHTDAEQSEILEHLEVNYFDAEYLDSFSFIEFISDMEEAFQIEFEHDQFEDRNFSTIQGMIDIISKMLEEV